MPDKEKSNDHKGSGVANMQRQKAFFLGLLAAAGAVLVLNCRPEVSRQKWNSQWGPLVPHKTFPADCGLCHTTEGWGVLREDFSFDHTARTGYVLAGAHADAACLRCHNDRGPVTAYLARGCGGCHPDPHASSLGLDCEKCHEQTSWRPTGSIADHARTGFHLVAAHAVAPCESCHLEAAVGQFRGAPRQCELCHQTNLASATSPDHIANGWTTNCERCHTPAGWAGADFQHYFFPLTGRHAGLTCTACHTGGTFQGLSSECYSCHAANYQGAPDHVALGFPTNCERCHTTAGWTPASFQHTFPLQGPHNVACSQCHTTGSTSTFNCLDCHEQVDTNNKHDDVDGYSYSSQACYQCHPNGTH
jgi:hypothetical protein